jgi:hypothetical protein
LGGVRVLPISAASVGSLWRRSALLWDTVGKPALRSGICSALLHTRYLSPHMHHQPGPFLSHIHLLVPQSMVVLLQHSIVVSSLLSMRTTCQPFGMRERFFSPGRARTKLHDVRTQRLYADTLTSKAAITTTKTRVTISMMLIVVPDAGAISSSAATADT